ncbi:MAG: YeeE/YedE family protein, partial [Acidilobus sp.]
QGCSVGGFWSGLAALSLFGLVFALGFIPGTIAEYYAYVSVSSAAARRARSARTATSVQITAEGWDVSALIAAILWSMVLAAVGLEFPAFDSLLRARLSSLVASQWSLVLEVMALLTLVIGVLGWARGNAEAS